mgnify:CR=1 FL=1
MQSRTRTDHRIARVQNNDQNVASVNHLLQLVEKGATRLRGCIILLDELRFLW